MVFEIRRCSLLACFLSFALPALSAHAGRAHVSNEDGQSASALSLKSVEEIEIGSRPFDSAMSAEFLCSANGLAKDVGVIDVAQMSVTGRIPVRETPWRVVLGAAPPAS